MRKIKKGLLRIFSTVRIVCLKITGHKILGSIVQDLALDTQLITENKGSIQLGKLINTKRRVVIKATHAKVIIGEDCFFNYGCGIFAHQLIQIGKSCSFGPNVMIFDHDHNFRNYTKDEPYKITPVVIGDNTWVGANTVILRGSVIGKNCVIGAGSVIKQNIPDDSLVMRDDSLKIMPIVK